MFLISLQDRKVVNWRLEWILPVITIMNIDLTFYINNLNCYAEIPFQESKGSTIEQIWI